MGADWEQRLAERTIAVAVAAGELVELRDPCSGEMYYAPVETTARQVPVGRPKGRHAARKRPFEWVRENALAAAIAGFLTLPAIAFGASSCASPRPPVTLIDPVEPDDSSVSVTRAPSPAQSVGPAEVPLGRGTVLVPYTTGERSAGAVRLDRWGGAVVRAYVPRGVRPARLRVVERAFSVTRAMAA